MKKRAFIFWLIIGVHGFVYAARAPFTLPTMTMAEIKELVPKAEKYRIGMNAAIIGLETMRYFSHDNDYVDSFVNDNFDALLCSIALIKVPALTVGAIAEADLSMTGVITDMVATTGIKGFWADVCTGHEQRTSTSVCIAAILLNGIVVAKIFNMLNPVIKKHYPAQTDEAKRRILRSTVIVVGNLLVPLVCYLADAANIIWFRKRSMQCLIDMSFWQGVMSNLIAEAAGYVIAQYVKEEGVISC